MELQGIYVRLIDTAGLNHTPAHPVEAMGIERTRGSLKEAHLLLYIVDGAAALEEADRLAFKEIQDLMHKPVLVIINKSDLSAKIDPNEIAELTGEKETLRISAKTNQGIEDLEKKIVEKILGGRVEAAGEQVTRLRHKNALENAALALAKAEAAFREKESLEFVIVDLKSALDCLRELIGEIYSEDLLDVIFSEFCIGK